MGGNTTRNSPTPVVHLSMTSVKPLALQVAVAATGMLDSIFPTKLQMLKGELKPQTLNPKPNVTPQAVVSKLAATLTRVRTRPRRQNQNRAWEFRAQGM